MKESTLKTAIATCLGITAFSTTPMASAGVVTADWSGYFTMLDYYGYALTNTSIPSKANQFVTPISGTMQFDDVTGAGTATLVPFNFLSNMSGYGFSASSFELQTIGDGAGGAGTLVLGNALFSWNGTIGIPVSMVLDAAGFFAGEYTSGGANSAVPATDSTYTDGTYGYLNQGSMPMVTTAWNTSFGPGCSTNSCMGVGSSGVLPLVYDTAPNLAYDGANTGGSIGGNPMADGPFTGYNANFNIGTISITGYDANAMIAPNCDFGGYFVMCQTPAVPVPAAAWLFGSGLIGLLGAARRRKT